MKILHENTTKWLYLATIIVNFSENNRVLSLNTFDGCEGTGWWRKWVCLFKPWHCPCLCPRWKFQFIFGSHFALIGPVVILQGGRSCSTVKMTQRNFLIIPHVPGSSVSFADSTPSFEGSVSSYSIILTLGISPMPRACAFFLYPSYFSVYIFRSNLCSDTKFTCSPQTLPKRIL